MMWRAVVRGVAVVLVGCLISDGSPRPHVFASPIHQSPAFAEQALAAKLANVRPPPVDIWTPITRALQLVAGNPEGLPQTFRPYREANPAISPAKKLWESIITFSKKKTDASEPSSVEDPKQSGKVEVETPEERMHNAVIDAFHHVAAHENLGRLYEISTRYGKIQGLAPEISGDPTTVRHVWRWAPLSATTLMQLEETPEAFVVHVHPYLQVVIPSPAINLLLAANLVRTQVSLQYRRRHWDKGTLADRENRLEAEAQGQRAEILFYLRSLYDADPDVEEKNWEQYDAALRFLGSRVNEDRQRMRWALSWAQEYHDTQGGLTGPILEDVKARLQKSEVKPEPAPPDPEANPRKGGRASGTVVNGATGEYMADLIAEGQIKLARLEAIWGSPKTDTPFFYPVIKEAFRQACRVMRDPSLAKAADRDLRTEILRQREIFVEAHRQAGEVYIRGALASWKEKRHAQQIGRTFWYRAWASAEAVRDFLKDNPHLTFLYGDDLPDRFWDLSFAPVPHPLAEMVFYAVARGEKIQRIMNRRADRTRRASGTIVRRPVASDESAPWPNDFLIWLIAGMLKFRPLTTVLDMNDDVFYFQHRIVGSGSEAPDPSLGVNRVVSRDGINFWYRHIEDANGHLKDAVEWYFQILPDAPTPHDFLRQFIALIRNPEPGMSFGTEPIAGDWTFFKRLQSFAEGRFAKEEMGALADQTDQTLHGRRYSVKLTRHEGLGMLNLSLDNSDLRIDASADLDLLKIMDGVTDWLLSNRPEYDRNVIRQLAAEHFIWRLLAGREKIFTTATSPTLPRLQQKPGERQPTNESTPMPTDRQNMADRSRDGSHASEIPDESHTGEVNLDPFRVEGILQRTEISVLAQKALAAHLGVEAFVQQAAEAETLFNHELAPLAEDPDAFIDFLRSRSHHANAFQKQARKAFARYLGIPEKNIIFVSPDDQAVSLLFDSVHAGLALQVVDGSERLVPLMLINNDFSDFLTLKTMVHEGIHLEQDPATAALQAADPLLRAISEGFMSVREVDMVLALEISDDQFSAVIRKIVNDEYQRQGIDAALFTLGFAARGFADHVRLIWRFSIDQDVYGVERRFVRALIDRVDEAAVRAVHQSSNERNIERLRQALGNERYDALTAFLANWESRPNIQSRGAGSLESSVSLQLAELFILQPNRVSVDSIARLDRFAAALNDELGELKRYLGDISHLGSSDLLQEAFFKELLQIARGFRVKKIGSKALPRELRALLKRYLPGTKSTRGAIRLDPAKSSGLSAEEHDGRHAVGGVRGVIRTMLSAEYASDAVAVMTTIHPNFLSALRKEILGKVLFREVALFDEKIRPLLRDTIDDSDPFNFILIPRLLRALEKDPHAPNDLALHAGRGLGVDWRQHSVYMDRDEARWLMELADDRPVTRNARQQLEKDLSRIIADDGNKAYRSRAKLLLQNLHLGERTVGQVVLLLALWHEEAHLKNPSASEAAIEASFPTLAVRQVLRLSPLRQPLQPRQTSRPVETAA